MLLLLLILGKRFCILARWISAARHEPAVAPPLDDHALPADLADFFGYALHRLLDGRGIAGDFLERFVERSVKIAQYRGIVARARGNRIKLLLHLRREPHVENVGAMSREKLVNLDPEV